MSEIYVFPTFRQVEFLSIVEGHPACSSLNILFVNKTNATCLRRSRCPGSEISADENYTTCLVKEDISLLCRQDLLLIFQR